jgi:hypothetical protein
MIGWTYTAALVLAVGFVLLRGGSEERSVAITLMAVSIGTYALYAHGRQVFDGLSVPLLLNESILLSVTLVVAYRSNRFWPLPVAAFEIAAILPLLTPLFGRNLESYALGVAQALWAYPQLTILVLATIRRRSRVTDPLTAKRSQA